MAEIRAFADLLAEKLCALDTREHCRHAYAGEHDPDDDSISADDFLYLRCVALVKGPKYHLSVLTNPSNTPKGVEFEALLDLAPNAFELKTGEELDHLSPKSFESFSNTAGWEKTAKTRPARRPTRTFHRSTAGRREASRDRFQSGGAVSRLCSTCLEHG